MIARCGCNGCVYWARNQDPTQVINGVSYWQCLACWALSHDPSDQRTPVLLPSVLTPAPKWSGKPPRIANIYVKSVIVEHGFTIEQFATRLHGRSDRARSWTKVRWLQMYTQRTQPDDSNGACWAP